jgi:hypothetical protein
VSSKVQQVDPLEFCFSHLICRARGYYLKVTIQAVDRLKDTSLTDWLRGVSRSDHYA